jgi:hypothetical protein
MNLVSSAFRSSLFAVAGCVAAPGVACGAESSPQAEILRIDRIWAVAEHSAFTDLVRYRERWFCTFREGSKHASPDGAIRVIASDDGLAWRSVARLAEAGIDLRDPKFSVTPDGRLMIVAGGSVMEQGKYVSRQPRVYFSADGASWTPPSKFLSPGHWLWRATWFRGKAYGVSYLGGGGTRDPRAAFLFQSDDGVGWKQITEFTLPNLSETTLRFLEDGEAIAFSVVVRPSASGPSTRATGVGSSRPPYREWSWRVVEFPGGGPNFLVLPDGRWIAATRHYGADRSTETVLAWLSRRAVEPFLTLPSGGDTSYAGLDWHEGRLWVSYYSSHEGKSAIYFAQIRVPTRR